MEKCKGLTARNTACNRKANQGDFCHSHQGQETDQPTETVKVKSVASSVTPDVQTIEDALSTRDAANTILKSFVSDKQLYHVWKQAKVQAGIAKVDFPYVWKTQKENLPKVMSGITRDDAKKALDAAFDKENPDRSLCYSLMVKTGIKDIQQSIQGENQEIDVAQRQALGKADKISNPKKRSILDQFSPEQLQGFSPEQLMALKG